MLDNNKGQAGIETIIAVAILLSLLVLVLWQVSLREQFNNFASDAYSNIEVCNRISSLINFISHNPTQNEIIINLDRDVTIANRTISVGDEYCLFYGPASDAALVPGEIRIYDYEGVVYLENA